MIKNIVYLGLGTNLGDKSKNIHEAVKLIEEYVGAIIKSSSLVISEPWGFDSKNEFLNAVIAVNTSLSPENLLSVTKQIEKLMGRTEKTDNAQYSDRIIDIDILLYNDIEINTPDLTIPHPLMSKRQFVMMPLKEIMAEDNYQKLTEKFRFI